MKRRLFLALAPAVIAARADAALAYETASGALPSPAQSTALDPVSPQIDLARLVNVIEQLETVQGWERSSVVAAKAFAAWQMRKALGLDLPDPKHAQLHVDFQREAFEDCKRTVWYETDIQAGKVSHVSPFERVLT